MLIRLKNIFSCNMDGFFYFINLNYVSNFRTKRGGALNVHDLCPTGNTVRNYLNNQANDLIKEKGARLLAALNKCGGSISIDYGKRWYDYISISVHFIENW